MNSDIKFNIFLRKVIYNIYSKEYFIGKYYLAKILSLFYIRPKRAVVIRLYSLFDLIVDPHYDNGVERALFENGTYEHAVFCFIKKYSKNFDVMLDIGANIGLFSILNSKLNPEMKIVSFEANPQTFDILTNNIKINNCKNINAFNLGISDNEGFVTLYENININRGGASFINKNLNCESSFTVKTITLDSVIDEFKEGEKLFLKIDVEGWESIVFKGALDFIQHFRPLILVEYSAERENAGDPVIDIYESILNLRCYNWFKFKRSKEHKSELILINNKGELPMHDNLVAIPDYLMNIIN